MADEEPVFFRRKYTVPSCLALEAWFPFTWLSVTAHRPKIQTSRITQWLVHTAFHLFKSDEPISRFCNRLFLAPSLFQRARLSWQSICKQQFALMVQEALTSNIRHILACVSWSQTRSCQADSIHCLLFSLNSHSHWSRCYFCSYVLHLFFEEVLVAPHLPFVNHTQGFRTQLTSQCSNNIPRAHSPPEDASPCLARLGVRPTHENGCLSFSSGILIKKETQKAGEEQWETRKVSQDYYPHSSFWVSEIKVLTTWPLVHVPWSFSG